MSTTLDTTILSGSVPKESDVDAPVRFPKKETEVARKADKISRPLLSRPLLYGAGLSDAEQNAFLRRSHIGGGVMIGGTLTAVFAVALGVPLGWTYSGMTGCVLGASIPTAFFVANYCGTLSYIYGPRSGRVICKNDFRERCGCIERCQVKRSRREAFPELEEVIIEQPTAKSPSPEPEPAKGGWLKLSSWFAKPSETEESVDESSREASPGLEEVIIDQPRAKSPSPEPEPAKGGWLSLSTWFAPPSETEEPVDESSV